MLWREEEEEGWRKGTWARPPWEDGCRERMGSVQSLSKSRQCC